jgi:hypothetical protein
MKDVPLSPPADPGQRATGEPVLQRAWKIADFEGPFTNRDGHKSRIRKGFRA